jgi:aquaporin Z
MRDGWKTHWPEYFMEAAGLGIFMISASVFTIALYHPVSPIVHLLPTEFTRRVLIGIAMGLTAIALIYSPWGKQSGAHLNPAVTFTFYRLGKVAGWDALFYVIAQFAGGLAGVAVIAAVAPTLLSHHDVNYVATLPGALGLRSAFRGEVTISFALMLVVLFVSNTKSFSRYTGICAGTCVAAFITFEAPLSGMSMNPARTFASNCFAGMLDSLWIYFVAPLLGMLLAAGLYRSRASIACAKLHHQNDKRCIFCEFHKPKCKEVPFAATTPAVAYDKSQPN